jgi:putative CocE/NonD family hydrolase
MREFNLDVKAPRRSTRCLPRLTRLFSQAAPLIFLAALLVKATEIGASPVNSRPSGWSDISYYLPMRDGVRLAVSIWFPEHHLPKKPVPVVLIQTRYGRAGVFTYGENGQYQRFLQAGFAVAVIDTRGTTSSYGSRIVEIGPQESADMDTLIRHFRRQPWSTGEIIATGVSYMADTADIAAAAPARLMATVVRESDFDAYLDLFSPGGVANDAMMNGWGGDTLLRDYGRSSNPKDGFDCAARAEDCAKLWPRLQPVDGDDANRQLRTAIASRARHWQPQDYQDVEFRDDKARNGYSEFSSSPAAYLAALRRELIPAQYWGSWMDAGTADAALARYRSLPQVPMDVWITANTHISDKLTDPFFPADLAPLPSLDEQWAAMLGFIERVRSHQPIARAIHYYVLGARTFRTTAAWPPSDARSVEWRFGPEHALIPATAASTDGEDRYTVDRSATTGDATRWSTQIGTPAAYPDRQFEDGKLLTYTSAPFDEDTELLGSASVTLYIATTSKDPAFFSYLEDVGPDGRVTYLTEGLFRAVHRLPASADALPYAQGEPAKSYLRKDAQPMVPGEVAKVTFPVFPVAALIRQGHRLRLTLSGADRSVFRNYGEDADVWRVERTALQPSALRVFVRRWSPTG